MPTISQSTLSYLPQRVDLQPYRKPNPTQLRSVSNIDIDLDSVQDAPSTDVRRRPVAAATGGPCSSTLSKVLLALTAIGIIGAAVGAGVGLTINATATTKFTEASTTTTTTMTSTTSTISTTTTTSTTSTTSTTTSTTSTTTTAPPPTYMYWPLDSNYNDFYNVYNGIGVNSPTFITPGYNGYGAALSVSGNNSQYVLVSLYKNMTYTSFTWELWAYPISLANYDCLMVGMCQTPVFSRCLYLMIRLNTTYFAFYGNDCWSTTTVPVNQWHHFGFVYDYSIQTQYIYFNGRLICTQTSAGPFLASSGAITIGAINNTGTTPSHFWTGYIDEVQYVSQVKTPAEILDDATLVASYSFDNGSFYDSGPNRINGTWLGLTSIAGRVNEAILLNGPLQAFRVSGLTLMGANYRAYSISVWIYRSSPAFGNGTIIHLSSQPASSGGWCLPILGLSSSFQVIGQNWNSSWPVAVTGPVIPLATWTHLVTSYSATNGIRLWVNGTLIGSSGPFSYTPSGVPNTIIAGSALNSTGFCATGNINHGQFYGRLDELKIYARELNATEVFALANP